MIFDSYNSCAKHNYSQTKCNLIMLVHELLIYIHAIAVRGTCLHAQAHCFTTSYTETGLFGIHAAASYFDIGKVCILFYIQALCCVVVHY